MTEESKPSSSIVQSGGGVVIGAEARVQAKGGIAGHDLNIGQETGEPDELGRLFEDLRGQVRSGGRLSAAEQREVLAQVDALEAELTKAEPDLGRVNTVKQSLLAKGAWLAAAVAAILQYPPVQAALQTAFQKLVGG